MTHLNISAKLSQNFQTFRISSWGSPELIYYVCVRVHAQRMKTCTQFGKCDTPQFLSQINLDFDETWHGLHVGIKDAPKIIWERYMHAHAHNMRKHAHYYNVHKHIFHPNEVISSQNFQLIYGLVSQVD